MATPGQLRLDNGRSGVYEHGETRGHEYPHKRIKLDSNLDLATDTDAKPASYKREEHGKKEAKPQENQPYKVQARQKDRPEIKKTTSAKKQISTRDIISTLPPKLLHRILNTINLRDCYHLALTSLHFARLVSERWFTTCLSRIGTWKGKDLRSDLLLAFLYHDIPEIEEGRLFQETMGKINIQSVGGRKVDNTSKVDKEKSREVIEVIELAN